ncbi:malonyl-CoA-acyl carrier protein-like protein transacylase [Lentithecium fluviatile CBS 122367]|uniref:[acyl-carrier-protein] S-malonyltransferase n=1 Tax=Lentithecium fluviatile CBS 122367 TaxID=1168545 RepID=A0A6G1JJS8_9PLEO|nr:malonyl-CoA-acyl carrier protein-like protein transacylase [Lentithecium fluviatile CBS 122367]
MSVSLLPAKRLVSIPSRRCVECGGLRQCGKPRRWMSSTVTDAKRPKTAIFFPGQGVQRVGMATPWLEAFPRTVQPILEEIDATLGVPLTKIIESGTNAELTLTENSQPAIMATSILILRVMEQEFGFKLEDRVDITLGHSLGEFAALVAGGYLTFQDALRMVRKRGEVMSRCSKEAVEQEGGEFGMVALVCESEQHMKSLVKGIGEFLELSSPESKTDSAVDIPAVEQVSIANINSKNQIVLSGSIARINTLMINLRQFGGYDPRHVQLKSDSPFHSPLMKPAQEVMKKILYKEREDGSDIVTWPGIMPCISNVSGRPFQSKDQLKDLLARSCVETVQWWRSIKYLHYDLKVKRYVGIGPGKVGRNLVGKEVGMKGAVKGGGVWGITTPKEMEEVVRALDDTEGVQED